MVVSGKAVETFSGSNESHLFVIVEWFESLILLWFGSDYEMLEGRLSGATAVQDTRYVYTQYVLYVHVHRSCRVLRIGCYLHVHVQ